MNKFVFIIALLFFACNSNDRQKELLKENELLKQELEIETQQKPTSATLATAAAVKNEKTNATISEIERLLPDSTVDIYGNFSIDMGSASSGRVTGNLLDVALDVEHLPERPGCADICPEMIVIHFKCQNNTNCITDPAFRDFFSDEGSISFVNIEKGKRIYDLLIAIQKTL
ncbi:MAG: hypothetical protein GX163_09025 [Bacteroidetes bacterium]|jgi:hypothetical protein|nr:hypothetical protein [Bacteroidota bacterium]